MTSITIATAFHNLARPRGRIAACLTAVSIAMVASSAQAESPLRDGNSANTSATPGVNAPGPTAGSPQLVQPPTMPGATTSQKLDNGNGVIAPPSQVDPGIRKAAPPRANFPTPIVPPPGTPGGNPNVISK